MRLYMIYDDILKNSNSINEICLNIYGYCNGRVVKLVKELIIKNGYSYKFFKSDEEKYNDNPKKCKQCCNIIPYIKKISNFCNSSCSASYNNSIRIHSDETKKKISKSIKKYNKNQKQINKTCKKCGKEFETTNHIKIYCSDNCSRKSRKYKHICIVCGKDFISNHSMAKTCSYTCLHKRQIQIGLENGWNSRSIISYPEQFFMYVLQNNDIEYIHNKKINKSELGLNCNSCYFLDFYISDKNIDLEIDGGQHKHEDRKYSDKIRDNALIDNGYNVYRIKWKDIKSDKGKEYIKNEIDKFLIYYNNIS